jgi:hypothetical protein
LLYPGAVRIVFVAARKYYRAAHISGNEWRGSLWGLRSLPGPDTAECSGIETKIGVHESCFFFLYSDIASIL